MSFTESGPSLSRKITVGYYLIVALIIGMAAITFYELASIEAKVRLGERTTELQDATLEIRRFERNFFLHRQSADQKENRLAVIRARTYLDQNLDGFAAIENPISLMRLSELLEIYEQRMTAYAAAAARADSALDAAESDVRKAGRELVAIANEMATTETKAVRAALNGFRLLLVAGIAAIAILIVVMSREIAHRIVVPLKTMEKNVEAISLKKSGLLEPPTRDREIVAITNAFNHMLHELELRQNHVIRAEKLASLGTMLSGVAHELNNPLSNISTSCQILLEEWKETDDATRSMYLNQIDEQCDRARHIVRSLLAFARHRDFRRERVPLQELVTQTLQFVRGDVPVGVAVQCDIPDTIAVAGDSQRLQQALLNLLKNAVEALSGDGLVMVSAQTKNSRAEAERGKALFAGCPLDGEVVDISISDNGPGIPADVLPRIFDPFYTTKDVGKGMGLGLFITHEVIEEHDGCIAVTTDGNGTTFHIRLPSAVTLREPAAIATADSI